MAVNLSPIGNGFQFFDNNGAPLNAGKIYTYQAGSSTPLATYTNSVGSVANANPIILGTSGRPPNEIWLSEGFFYKFILKDSSDATIQTYDNLYGILGVTPPAATPIPAGGIILWSGSIGSIPAGYVLCNGSNGTPDLRDRFVIGAGSTYAVDATGGSTSYTPTGSVVTTNTATALTEAQMPKHFHSLRGPNGPFESTVPSATASGSGNYGGGTPDDGTAGYGTNSVGGSAASGSNSTGTSNGDTHNHTAASSFTGNAATIIGPYFALCYIMKT
jgi:hypothetical protein